MERAFEYFVYALIFVSALGWTNIFGDKLNWWYLAYWLAN